MKVWTGSDRSLRRGNGPLVGKRRWSLRYFRSRDLRQTVLIPTDIPLAEVASLGRNCNWNRPSCSCGSEKVWGHGYVTRYCVGLASALLLKRYRCPLCGRVFTMIPADSGRRIQSPVSAVLGAIRSRFSHQGCSPQPQCQHQGWTGLVHIFIG
jgi:hypothetical protein